MEDYDKFVQHRFSKLRKSEEERRDKPPTTSSLICFYGRAILPPLLSGERREEMQRHRDAAQKVADCRMLKKESRIAHVQTILHSVQVRKTPTLEELLRDSEIFTKSSQSHFFDGTKDSVSPLPPSGENIKDGVTPMTSTTYSAFFTSNTTPQSHQSLIDQRNRQQDSQPGSLNGVSYQSESSGYITCQNDLGTGGHDFFFHNTSNTIAKMPDIINYPPIDGEELERSGLESSFSNLTVQEDAAIWDHSLLQKSESNYLDCVKGEETPHLTFLLDLDRDHSFDKTGSLATEVSNNSPEVSATLSSHHCPKPELHVQHETKDTNQVDRHIEEAETSEEPYRLSLQALLKKSQEYRRHQRLLRNQAKNTKIQERTQELERAKAEEQSHSDKENDEFPYKGSVTAENMRSKDKRGSFGPTIAIPIKNSWEKERVNDSRFVGKNINMKSECTYSTGDKQTNQMPSVEEEVIFNNKLDSSPEVIAEPKKCSGLLQQPPISEEDSLKPQDAFYLTSSPTASCKGARKYHSIPVPNLCRSPVNYKNRGTSKDGQAADEADEEKAVGKSGLNEDHRIGKESSLGHQNILTALAAPVSVIVEGSETMGMDFAMSSQHIDQLESSLSSLKVLISDLEYTVKQNLENHSQTERNTQNECSFKGIEQIKDELLQQRDRGHVEETLSDGVYSEHRQWPSRESFKNCQNMHDGRGPSVCDTDDFPLIVQGKGSERINISELRLVKAVMLDRQKNKETEKEELIKVYNCRKQLLSVSSPQRRECSFQRMLIPDVFRNVPSNVSVLSDTSNHPVDRRNETAGKDHNSTHTSSLNQSYDVETPSNLWLLDQSGSDSGSKGLVAQENQLTPKSEGEGQGSVSKVKRRLLLCGTQERSPDASGGANSVVRTSVRAPVQVFGGHGSQKDRQEQLKQVHAAQIRALQDEHKRQQQELLQALAARYSLLQSMSFPCSMSASRLGDTLTFSTLSQPSSRLSECYRPLLSAAVKGFLTRRLLRTERVSQLVRTVRDTQQFLQAFQQQSPNSKQDLLLQERVTLQLCAARYEVYDIFFSLSAGERMQLINWDRELARERQLRRQSGQPKGRSSLSIATQKSLERKKGIMMERKAAEKHRGVVTRTGHKTGFTAEQPLKTKRGQFRANPQRVSKNSYSTRPR